MSGFVYIWYDRKHKRYYLGSHWGREDDGYVCSSRWMRNAYKIRPNDFKRRILARVEESRQALLHEEQRWLFMIKPEELKVRYYNAARCASGWRTLGMKKTDEHKRKISDALKGRKHSEERRRNISNAQRGKKRGPHSEEHVSKIRESLTGKKHTEERRLNNSKSHRGKNLSEEHRRNIGNSLRGKKRGPYKKKCIEIVSTREEEE